MPKKIHSIYDVSPKKPYVDTLPSMTIQSAKQECDINYILQKFLATGTWSTNGLQLNKIPSFGDFTADFDFQTAQQMIVEAKQAFEQLPAAVRKRFNNNPAEVLQFLGDDANREEAVRLGLVNSSVVLDNGLDLVPDDKVGG